MSLIDSAADAIVIGELISAERFDLQESMSALEIMDPQMDSGMTVVTKTEEKPAVDAPESPSHALIIGLLDELLSGEHGWYGGVPLPSSIYRLDWMYDAHQLSSLPLRASLLAAARTTAALRSIICRADIHEEEDFNPSIGGTPLHEGVSDTSVIDLLMKAEEAVQAELRELKTSKAGGGDRRGYRLHGGFVDTCDDRRRGQSTGRAASGRGQR